MLGKRDDRNPASALVRRERAQQRGAVVGGEIADDDVRHDDAERAQGVRDRFRGDDGAAGAPQHRRDELARVAVVVDHEYRDPADVRDVVGGPASALAVRCIASGKVTTNVEPCPSPALVASHRAAVQLREVLHDRQAEPEAAVFARDRAVRLAERIEDVRQKLRRDAAAFVANR